MKKSLTYTLLILISYQINGMEKPTQAPKKSAQDIIKKMREYTEDPAQRADAFIRANSPEPNPHLRWHTSNLFFLACKSKKPDTLAHFKKELPEKLCNIRCPASQITLLHEAALHGNTDVLKFLVEDCECLSLIDNQDNRIGATPAMMAALKGHLPVINYLISRGANLRLTDKARRTIIHYASWELPAIKLLGEKEPRAFFMRDRDGNNPLIWAKNNNCTDVEKYLKEFYETSRASIEQVP